MLFFYHSSHFAIFKILGFVWSCASLPWASSKDLYLQQYQGFFLRGGFVFFFGACCFAGK